MKTQLRRLVVMCGFFALVGASFLRAQEEPNGEGLADLEIKGSDTMLQMNLALIKDYRAKRPGKDVKVSGEGSFLGFKGLIDGTAHISCSSRLIKDSEKAKIKAKFGKDPVKHTVAYDAIAVYVRAGSTLESVDMETLKEIFFEGGKIDRWDQLPGNEGAMGGIELVGRANSSGTYAAFRKMVAGQRSRYKKGIVATAGSVALIEKIGSTQQAIGYAGVSYATKAVKALKLAAKRGAEPVAPTAEKVRAGNYPLTRPLYYYTVGEPEGEAKAFIDWLKSDGAKKIIAAQGFISAG